MIQVLVWDMIRPREILWAYHAGISQGLVPQFSIQKIFPTVEKKREPVTNFVRPSRQERFDDPKEEKIQSLLEEAQEELKGLGKKAKVKENWVK